MSQRPDDAAGRGYPPEWEADVALRDGGTVHVRPIRPDDAAALVAFHSRQSPQSIYFRYFSARPVLSEKDVRAFTEIDYDTDVAFIALLGDEMVGVARYVRWPDRSDAEVAFFVDDDHGQRGMATVLLEYLAAAARQRGVSGFTAQVLPDNYKMLGVFRAAGFEVASRFADGVVEVLLGIDPTESTVAKIEERERNAEVASVKRLLAPRSVAVVGAGRSRGGLGHEVYRHLVSNEFEGPVYPVNPRAATVASTPAYPTVLDIPGPVDVAVVAVPAEQVPEVVAQCATRHVAGLIVISAGFAETGEEGAALERSIVETARLNGMRLLGPNCLGAVNTDPEVRMHATFTETRAEPGGVGILAQSGLLGTAVLDFADQLGMGISTFVAAGNRADVSVNDLLQYWEADDRTSVVLLYLESFGNLRKFTRIARRLSALKPVIVVKGGRAAAGAAGRLPEQITAALFRQTGLVRVETLGELLDTGRVADQQPLPRGPHLAVVGNSDGAARLAADAAQGAGLLPAPLSSATTDALRERFGPQVGPSGALDLTFRATADDYRHALGCVLADDGVDAVMVIHASPSRDQGPGVRQTLIEMAAAHPDIPIVATLLSTDAGSSLEGPGVRVPVFRFPEEAARALGRLAAYRHWRDAHDDGLAGAEIDIDGVRQALEEVLGSAPSGRRLADPEIDLLLAAAGIDVAPRAWARSEGEAVELAGSIGYPVVLKASNRPPTGRSQAGGLALDLQGADEVRDAHRRMRASLGAAIDPVCVQAMVERGLDVAAMVVQDPTLGSAVALGIGGLAASVDDSAVAVLPVTRGDARRLLADSRLGHLLDDPADRDAVVELVLRLGELAEVAPELTELVCNPIALHQGRAVVTDTLAAVAPVSSARLLNVRGLG